VGEEYRSWSSVLHSLPIIITFSTP
jgi:hypothetical protein